MRLFSLPWHYYILAGIVCMGLTIFSAMHQTDPARDHKDRPIVIALGGVVAVLAWVFLITGAVKFVLWWRQG